MWFGTGIPVLTEGKKLGHQQIRSFEDSELERRKPGGNDVNRKMGRVVSCNGSRATIAANTRRDDPEASGVWTVGKLVTIQVGESRIVSLVYSVHAPSQVWSDDLDNQVLVEVELLGEISNNSSGQPEFSAGISSYPFIGALVHRIRTADLAAVYSKRGETSVKIGNLSQDGGIDASISIDKLLDRHFAVLGTTGVGKSTAVSLLLQKAIESRKDLRVLILDPHNEFASAFPDRAEVIDTDTLDLPFWLFKLEELTEVLFRGRPGVPEEIDILRDVIPEAKRAFRGQVQGSPVSRVTDKKTAITADTPLPYRVADLLALIDDRIGRLEGRDEKPHLRSIKNRIMAALNDPRYKFMFSSNTIQDTILDTIGQIFRIPDNGRPIAVFQLAGIPSEVVNSVASVLCRMAFDIALWGGGNLKILVVCEEAHRYVPADEKIGFFPTRQAIARIAKEGRKYGVSLGVITQRPGELDSTILSQCSTVFAMRLSNEHDQEIIKSAIPDSSVSTTSFLSSIGNREAIAFGDAVAVPMRMQFAQVNTVNLPKTQSADVDDSERSNPTIDLKRIVTRMRQVATPGPEEEQAADHATTAYNAAVAAQHQQEEAQPDPQLVFNQNRKPVETSEEDRLAALKRHEQRLASKSSLLKRNQPTPFKQTF